MVDVETVYMIFMETGPDPPRANETSRGPASAAPRALKGAERIFLVGLVVWILCQTSRAIALALIDSIEAGAESQAWMYPAYLDLFAVVLAPPLTWAVLKRRGLITWSLVIVYWAISIVDHVGNFVTTTIVGPPSIAEGMSNPYLVPAIQTVLDVAFLALLFVPRYRNLFFRLETNLANYPSE